MLNKLGCVVHGSLIYFKSTLCRGITLHIESWRMLRIHVQSSTPLHAMSASSTAFGNISFVQVRYACFEWAKAFFIHASVSTLISITFRSAPNDFWSFYCVSNEPTSHSYIHTSHSYIHASYSSVCLYPTRETDHYWVKLIPFAGCGGRWSVYFACELKAAEFLLSWFLYRAVAHSVSLRHS
jgi:hypothetical protein